MKNSIAFVVLTCDNYSDLWPMFVHFTETYWDDCPYDKYFITNNKTIPDSSFEFIPIGKDEDWSDGLLKAISVLKLKYDYIIITLEDCPIVERVDQIELNSIITSFLDSEGNFLALFTQGTMAGPTRKFNNYFGIIDKGSLYRPNTVYSLWRISTLEDLLVRGENAWEFEKYGSVRSDKYDGFFMVYKTFYKISNTVIKGKWQRSEYKKIINLGYYPDVKSRKVSSYKEELLFKLYRSFFNIFMYFLPLSHKIRRKLVFFMRGYKAESNSL